MKRTRTTIPLERPTYDLRGLQIQAMRNANKRCLAEKAPQSTFERYMNEELDKLITWHEETQA